MSFGTYGEVEDVSYFEPENYDTDELNFIGEVAL
jgi:hypothetical protein